MLSRWWLPTAVACSVAAQTLAAQAPVAPAKPGGAAYVVTLEPVGAPVRTELHFLGETGQPLSRLAFPNIRVRSVSLSPDGQSIAYQVSNDLGLDTIVAAPVPGATMSAPVRTVSIGALPQWSADALRILFSRRQFNDYGVYAAAADGSERDARTRTLVRGQIGRWSPDGKRVAVLAPALQGGSERWQVQILGGSGGSPELKVSLPEGAGQAVAMEWSPSGRDLLVTSMENALPRLYRVGLDPPLAIPVGTASGAAYGCWTPDGRVAYAETVGQPARVMVIGREGAPTLFWQAERGKLVRGLARRPNAPLLPPVPAVTPVVKPAPVPPVVDPAPVPPRPPVLPPAPILLLDRVALSRRTVSLNRSESPRSIALERPGLQDFEVTVPLDPMPPERVRRQGVGVTVELASGALFRVNILHNRGPWATLQGRLSTEPVHLVEAKSLDPLSQGYLHGGVLRVRREGGRLSMTVDGREVIASRLVTGPVVRVSLTLENFDPEPATFPLGDVRYREWGLLGGDSPR